MTHVLHIKYDGDTVGLAAHRLSLSEFGPALEELLRAVRRSVSNHIANASDAERGSKGGRLAKLAESVDLQIASVREGSVELDLRVEVVDGQLDLLAVQGGLTDFVESVQSESSGTRRSATVRKYLKSLPAGLTSHSYRAARDGHVFATAEVGDAIELVDENSSARGPMLVDIDGVICGVDFSPLAVRVNSELGRVRLNATEELVAQAIALREGTVRIRYLPTTMRLLAIHADETGLARRDFNEAADEVFETWSEVLRRLSR